MNGTKVLSVEQFSLVEISNIPDGEYDGIWGGYEVEFTVDGKKYKARTENGVRGMNIPCVVSVRFGVAMVR